ncbi:MAG: DMT family transporter [Flavobacteriaceae bacterium]
MTNHTKNLLLLTVATLLISTSGALGKFINTPVAVAIWFRCFVGGLALLVFCKYKGIVLNIKSKQDAFELFVSGLFLGIHWVTYFYALKLSNVAIGMLSLFTFPIITAFLEPLFFKTPFDRTYIVLGIMVLAGIYILAPDFDLHSSHVKGVLFGLVSAVFYALRNILSKKLTKTYSGTSVMLYQVGVVSVILTPCLLFLDTSNIASQLPYLLVLAILTTAVGHTMLVNSLKHFSVSTASIINSTQPIFGIIIAYFFLNEIPELNTYIGGALILATVVIESVRSGKMK